MKSAEEFFADLVGNHQPIFAQLLKELELGYPYLEINEPFSLSHPDFVCIERKFTTKRIFTAYKNIAKKIEQQLAFSRKSASLPFDPALHEQQQEAIAKALTHPLSLITGGPGTGKTYTLEKLISSFRTMNPQANITFLAPTGKALQKMQHYQIHLSTIHKYLGLTEKPSIHQQKKDAIEDLLIVDEASMIDLFLMEKLFSSLLDVKHLVFVGDPHQLPAIGTMGIFQEMSHIASIPKTHLTMTHRTSNRHMANIFHALTTRNFDELRSLPLNIYPTSEIEKQWPKIVSSFTQEKSVVVTPFNHGPYGTDRLNQRLAKELPFEKHPIICTKNMKEFNIYNGQEGFLQDGLVSWGKYFFSSATFPYFSLAYALTIHKSQGSEFDHVIALFPESSEMFPYELFYTALTRAKKNLTLFIDETTLSSFFQENIKHLSLLSHLLS